MRFHFGYSLHHFGTSLGIKRMGSHDKCKFLNPLGVLRQDLYLQRIYLFGFYIEIVPI